MTVNTERTEAKLELLDELRKEAHENYKKANKIFKKYDDVEAMHATKTWDIVMDWLDLKIKALK